MMPPAWVQWRRLTGEPAGTAPGTDRMAWDDFLPVAVTAIIALVAALALALVLALKAVFENRELRAQFADLSEKFLLFDERLVRLTAEVSRLAPPPPQAAAPVAAAPETAAAGPASAPVETPAAPAATELAPTGRGWEQVLVEHWLVWLGGATIALGGAFLVKLSIDYGLLTPAVRVILAILLGVGLSVGGEWLRRREPPSDTAEDTSAAASYVPQALVAAGAATIFAALYAGYALYHLLPAGLVAPLLAATAFATVAQALLQGPYVAALGLVGAYAVPLLVANEAPSAVALFAYLALVTAAALTVLRHRAWWWLAWLAPPAPRRRSWRFTSWCCSGWSRRSGGGSRRWRCSRALPTARSCGR
jgi:Predicted membrane protein (DUF2339)